jgi:signal transduction histidine kinase
VTIARHRLLDVQVLFRAGMLYSTLTFLVSVVYFALVLGLQRWLQDAVFAGSLLLPMLPALAVALAVGPLKSSLQERLDRTFFRSRAQMRARGEEYAEVLRRFECEADVWLAAWEHGWRHAHPESGLVLRHADGSFLTAAGTGTAGVDAEAAGQQVAGLAGPKRLAAGGPFEIALPVVGRGGLLGGCLLGPKSSGEIWSAEDLAFCAAIAGQTALAVEQARLRERLGRMAAVVAHEMRNPLNSIVASVGVLRLQIADQPGAAILGVIEQDIGRGERFIRDILFACREKRTRLVAIDLAISLREFAAGWACGEFSEAHLELAAPAAELWVRGDVFQLRQVFDNLARNAVEAGGRKGRIALRVERPAGRGITISVTDDGPGIEPRLLPVIFEPFRTTKVKGTGLGLSIAKGIVEGHGGRISAANRPGGGAVFRVWLPAIEEPGGFRPGEGAGAEIEQIC